MLQRTIPFFVKYGHSWITTLMYTCTLKVQLYVHIPRLLTYVRDAVLYAVLYDGMGYLVRI